MPLPWLTPIVRSIHLLSSLCVDRRHLGRAQNERARTARACACGHSTAQRKDALVRERPTNTFGFAVTVHARRKLVPKDGWYCSYCGATNLNLVTDRHSGLDGQTPRSNSSETDTDTVTTVQRKPAGIDSPRLYRTSTSLTYICPCAASNSEHPHALNKY